MALAFPLALADFFDGLRIRESVFWLPEQLETDRTAGGEVLVADHGARLWEGRVTLAADTFEQIGAAEAKLSILAQAGRSFYVHPMGFAYPAADPGGVILGAAVPLISSVAADRRSLTIKALPAGYQLRPGDFLAFAYGSSPVRRALHRVVVGATASGTGVASNIEVTPEIRAGAAANAVITLKKPFCKAVMLPGSIQSATQQPGGWMAGPSFSFVQTLR